MTKRNMLISNYRDGGTILFILDDVKYCFDRRIEVINLPTKFKLYLGHPTDDNPITDIDLKKYVIKMFKKAIPDHKYEDYRNWLLENIDEIERANTNE